MANPVKATGFRPVQNTFGQTWDASLAALAIPSDVVETWDGIFIGMPVVVADEENGTEGVTAGYPMVHPMSDEMTALTDKCYGVVIGIGRPGETADLANQFGMFNPADLTTRHITVAEVENDTDGFVLYCVPADQWIFEAQVEAVADTLTIGDGVEVNAADLGADEELGNTTTGICNYELVVDNTTPSWIVVGYPDRPDNDIELAAAKVHVMAAWPFAPWTLSHFDGGASETARTPALYSTSTG